MAARTCERRSRPGAESFGRTSYENVIKPCRALSCRYPVNCVAVWPHRRGNLANHTKLHASQRHDRSAEASGKAATGGKVTRVRSGGTPRPDIAIHSNGDRDAVVCARFDNSEACIERAASSCNDGCETSFKRGNAPWVGCSVSAGFRGTFSATCTDTLTHRDYVQCTETKMFTGWDRQRAWWYCTSLMIAGRFRVTEANRYR